MFKFAKVLQVQIQKIILNYSHYFCFDAFSANFVDHSLSLKYEI